MIKWHTQAININTNLKVKTYFTLPEFSETKIVTWDCHVYHSAKGRYDMMLVIDTLIVLLLNIKFSERVIEADDGN